MKPKPPKPPETSVRRVRDPKEFQEKMGAFFAYADGLLQLAEHAEQTQGTVMARNFVVQLSALNGIVTSLLGDVLETMIIDSVTGQPLAPLVSEQYLQDNLIPDDPKVQ